jgi:protein tyrosine phosphatase (PTP) superfamily phosphohydrolase (DUF442 family)
LPKVLAIARREPSALGHQLELATLSADGFILAICLHPFGWMKAVDPLWLALCFTAHAEINHFYRVDKSISRGTQPQKEDFPKLAQMGIRTVLDLRGGRIPKPRERKRVEAAGMRYISIRLSGIFPAKNPQIAQVLAVLEDPANAPLFVHCWRDDDRVGLVIACYRMDHTTTGRTHRLSKKLGTKAQPPGSFASAVHAKF